MGLLFNNPNKKVEKIIKNLERQGYSNTAYKSRKCCENCKFLASNGYCNMDKHRHPVSDLCHNWWGK